MFLADDPKPLNSMITTTVNTTINQNLVLASTPTSAFHGGSFSRTVFAFIPFGSNIFHTRQESRTSKVDVR